MKISRSDTSPQLNYLNLPIALRDVAEKLSIKEPLNKEDVRKLLCASLPQLLKLVELAKITHNFAPVELKAVLFLPVNKLISEKGLSYSEDSIRSLLQNLNKTIVSSSQIYLTIDNWSGTTSFKSILDFLEALTNDFSHHLSLAVLPPSANQLRQVLSEFQKSPSSTLPKLVHDGLKGLGISTIDGEDDIELLQQAAKSDFLLAISCSEFGLASLEEIVLDLFELRYQQLLIEKITSWSPTQTSSLSVVNVTKALHLAAIARLLLPDIKHISIPISLMKTDIAQIAGLFGVNDFGYAAIDSHTASTLKITPLSVAQRVLNLELVETVITSLKRGNGK